MSNLTTLSNSKPIVETKNNTTFPINWKELVRAGPQIFQLYLQYLYDGQVRYGPRTIVFMQVGMFHEMYGVENETMNVGLVSQMAHDLNIQMTRRKKSVIENSPKNYLMAGFPSVHLDRYINILVEEDWTVIVVDQIEQDPKLALRNKVATSGVSGYGATKEDTGVLTGSMGTTNANSNADSFMGLTDVFAATTIEEVEEAEDEADEGEEGAEDSDLAKAKPKTKAKTTAISKTSTSTTSKPKKIVSRAITRVASPSTFVEKTMKSDNNFLVSLFLREDKFVHKKPGQALSIVAVNGTMLLSVGCSAIDLTTGENYSYEVYSNVEDPGLAIDEAFRFICTFTPREIVINSENLHKYTEDSLISKLELHNISHHIDLNHVRPDFKKISYQNTVLKKCFPGSGALSPLEYLDMEVKSLAALSYILMLQYAYEHNEKLIDNLPKPKILETYSSSGTLNNSRPKNLVLANNTINQLNLIPEVGSTANSNNHSGSKIFRSVLTVINKTSTAMGSRLLRHKFLNPITDPDILEEHYSQIEELRRILPVSVLKNKDISHSSQNDSKDASSTSKNKEINEVSIWSFLESHMRIKDVERMNRKINLKTIQPLEWIELDQDLTKVNQLVDIVNRANVLKSFLKEKENLSLIADLANLQTYYKSILDLDEAAKYTLAGVEDNFFKPKFDEELDNIGFKIKHYEQFFKTMTRSLSNMVTPGTDYVSLKRSEGGYCLNITKTRYAQLKAKFKDPLNFTIDNTTYTVLANDLIDRPVSSKSSNLNVYNECLTKMSLELGLLHEELRLRVIEKYYGFLEDFSRRFGQVLTRVSQFVARIDVLKSMAKVADEYNYCKPEIVRSSDESLKDDVYKEEPSSFIEATNLRHPIIERINQAVKYVPHNICLGRLPTASSNIPTTASNTSGIKELSQEHTDQKISETKDVQDGMIVYGMNASGKSSLMKSVGVNLILAQAGFYVPATSFKFYPYEQILTRIIGDDNLFKGQSSFEVEMIELRGILSRARNQRCLVLADEVSRGTESLSGVSIVAASAITLAKARVSFIFTSHLHQVSTMPRVKNLKNVNCYHLKVMYDEKTGALIYDRNLTEGPGDPVYGLEVLKGMGMNPEFIELAHEIRKEIMAVPPSIVTMRQSKYNTNLYMTECQVCKGPADDTHHINGQCTADDKGFIDHFHKNVLSNLVPLCKKCHLAAHGCGEQTLKINGYKETSEGLVFSYDWTPKDSPTSDV